MLSLRSLDSLSGEVTALATTAADSIVSRLLSEDSPVLSELSVLDIVMSLIVVAVAVGAGGEGAGVAHLVGGGALGDLAHPVGVHRGTLSSIPTVGQSGSWNSRTAGILVSRNTRQPEYSSAGILVTWLLYSRLAAGVDFSFAAAVRR